MLFLVTMHFCSGNATSVPYDTILENLNRVSLGQGWGNWVGLPRVVRSRAGECAWDLKVARLYEVPGTLSELAQSTLVAQLGSAVDQAFRGNSDNWASAWAQTQIVPYNAQTNGSRDFWESGQASRTRTRDDWDYGNPENPTGPANILPQRVGATDAIREGMSNLNVVPIVVGAAVIITMVYVGPALGRWLSSRQRRENDPYGDRDVDFSGVGLQRPRRR